ncbi:MAG: glycoside hydrolase family 127 protein [Armatimonadetes bacterium]|nr:glycoside hydrolase family 127 protein [Armatimonadota bacterium]
MFFKIILATGGLCLVTAALASAGALIPKADNNLTISRATFLPLRFGAVKPRGWILEQMRRDLRDGFAGHLDELCREASSDIFAVNRNQPGKPNSGNAEGVAWWNGETEGNWRCGHIMMACLTGEPNAVAKAKAYVEHILAAQDADGYLGIFSPELRYKGNGDLWAQTCLFRGLLAYADATGDEKVWTAVKRAADRTIEGYASCLKIEYSQHDAMFTAILEQLYARTGDRKYIDFGLRLYREYPGMKEFFENPAIKHADGTTTLNGCLSYAHGATVSEAMRVPLWFWSVMGDEQYLRVGKGAVDAMDACIMPSGALVSDELVNRPPQPWDIGYEYCAILERELTLFSAAQKFGDAKYAEVAEHLWVNAAQGSRTPDGTAVLYCSPENRLSVNDEIGKRQRFSPTHQQTAVCCNPNATRVAPYYIANSWMRPNGAEPAIAAMLYGPSELSTEIAGVSVSIKQTTLYPYSGDVKMTVSPSKPVAFCMWLRNPSWSQNTQIVCPGAKITLANGFWQVRKKWKAGDTVSIRFDQAIREAPAINGEIALQYGPLLYVLPVPGTPQVIKTYNLPGLSDYLMSADNGGDKMSLSADQRKSGFGFAPKKVSTKGANPDRPLDNPQVVLEGKLVNEFYGGAPVPVQLVPMGAQSARLRQVTFPVASVEKQRPYGRFKSSGSAAAIPAQPGTLPMFDHWLVGEKQPIICQFAAKPKTAYQVFVGFNEAWWDKQGQRMMDIEISGKIVATVDSFNNAKGAPSGHIFKVMTDERGGFTMRICPHPDAPDPNPVVCGVLLFPGDATLDADAIIHQGGPKPLVTLPAANFNAQR